MAALYVVRHAQAASAGAGARDHDRRLDAAGTRAAALVGGVLAMRLPAPELVLCSSALRAVETWRAMAAALPAPGALSVEAGLYLAEPENLLERLQAVPPATRSAVLVGHNPGLHLLVALLVGGGEATALAELAAGFPPGAVVALTLAPGGWAAIAPASCRLDWLLLPETLA